MNKIMELSPFQKFLLGLDIAMLIWLIAGLCWLSWHSGFWHTQYYRLPWVRRRTQREINRFIASIPDLVSAINNMAKGAAKAGVSCDELEDAFNFKLRGKKAPRGHEKRRHNER